MSQERLALEVGVGRTQVVNIEAGKTGIPVDNLIKICRVLGVTPDYILDYT